MPKVTISDIAREAGVSKQTVSRALNGRGEISDQTSARILAICDRLGYRPSSIARSLATQRTYSIGVTVPEIIHPFYAELVTSMQRTAWEAGYSLFQIATGSQAERQRSALQTMENQWVDGVICCRIQLDVDETISRLSRFKAALVVSRNLPDSSIGQITQDNAYAMSLAVDHLVAIGCRNIALLVGRMDRHGGRSRADAFLQAVKAAGSATQAKILQTHVLNLMYDWAEDWMKNGLVPDRATMDILGAHPDIDGLLCYNDIYAIGAMRALQRIGKRVPQDVAVMGVDDVLMARLTTPSLTTLAARTADIGEAAVKMVIDSLEGRSKMESVIFRHHLVVRESTTRAVNSQLRGTA